MKRFFLFAFVAVLAAGAQAQTIQSGGMEPGFSPRVKPNHATIPNFNKRATGSEWLNYAADVQNCITQSEANTVIIPIFPDSTLISGWNELGDTFGVFYHAAATQIDPTAMPCAWLVPGNDYVLDSMSVEYGYVRNTDASVVDTLVVHLIKNLNNQVYGFADGFVFQAIFFDSVNQVLRPNQILQTFRIPLTEADSTLYDASTGNINLTSMDFPTPVTNLAANARVGAVIEFHPGYTWDNVPPYTDSLFNKNSFWLVSREPYGADTEAPVEDTIYSLNVSSILPNDVYYNMTGEAWGTAEWDGFFIPTWAYTAPYNPEHHGIWFKLTSNNLGVNEAANGFAIIGTRPNPANNTATLGIVLVNSANNVTVDVTDILGRRLTGMNLGTLAAGPHEFTLNTSLLANGVYNCTVTSGKNVTTTKMVVAH